MPFKCLLFHAKDFKCNIEDIEIIDKSEGLYEIKGHKYYILSDSQADKKAEEYVKDSFESASDDILTVIENTCGVVDFLEAAINASNRGNFISTNGIEIALDISIDGERYYAYRL